MAETSIEPGSLTINSAIFLHALPSHMPVTIKLSHHMERPEAGADESRFAKHMFLEYSVQPPWVFPSSAAITHAAQISHEPPYWTLWCQADPGLDMLVLKKPNILVCLETWPMCMALLSGEHH